jgi:hypothetical protein
MSSSIVTQALRSHTPTKVRHEKLRQAIDKVLVEIRPTNKGRGLFALSDFAPGEVIVPVDGVVTYGDDRDALAGAGDDYSICFRVGERLQRITPRVAEIGWHCANQSCKPNAKIGDCLLAVRAIRAGDEITTCYGWFTDQAASTKCLCGEPRCFGKLAPSSARGTIDADDLRAFIENQIANENAIGLESTTGVLGKGVVPKERASEVDALLRSIPKRADYRISEHRLREMGFYVE